MLLLHAAHENCAAGKNSSGMENKFRQRILVPCYDTDVAKLLKPASFMDLAQEAANLHANILGFGYDNLMETRTAWVLSRMHIRFLRHPRWREEVDLTTWHKGLERLFYLRDFQMTDTEGNVLVEATTSWLVLNIDTRRLVRDAGICEEGVCRDNAIPEPCDKVQMPSDCLKEQVCVHKVSYSDVDVNGHTNNAMYLVWSMDAVGYDVASSRPLKEMKINFNHETRPGDEVAIGRACTEQDGNTVYYVEGIAAGRQAFCVELVF